MQASLILDAICNGCDFVLPRGYLYFFCLRYSPPNAEDIASRTERAHVDGAARKESFLRFSSRFVAATETEVYCLRPIVILETILLWKYGKSSGTNKRGSHDACGV